MGTAGSCYLCSLGWLRTLQFFLLIPFRAGITVVSHCASAELVFLIHTSDPGLSGLVPSPTLPWIKQGLIMIQCHSTPKHLNVDRNGRAL